MILFFCLPLHSHTLISYSCTSDDVAVTSTNSNEKNVLAIQTIPAIPKIEAATANSVIASVLLYVPDAPTDGGASKSLREQVSSR